MCSGCALRVAVEHKANRIKLPVFVNTGGVNASLNLAAWKILASTMDVSVWDERTFSRGKVHGLKTDLYLFHGNLQGVITTGKEWLSAASVMLVVDYEVDGCLLLLSDEELRGKLPELPVTSRGFADIY